MSASSIINNLNQAINCAGKCDCCDRLQSQINQINQQLNQYLKREEKTEIIQQSISGAEQLIVPGIAIAIAKAIDLIKPEIALAIELAKSASNLANSLLSKLAPLLGALNALLALAAAAGTLLVLGSRMDALERGLDLLGSSVDKSFSLISTLKSRIDNISNNSADAAMAMARNALTKANEAIGLVGTLERNLESKISAATATASQALSVANQALNRALTPGKPGERGLPGIQGLKGDKGDTGIQGLRGLPGKSASFDSSIIDSILSKLGRLESSFSQVNSKINSLGGELNNIKSKIGIIETAISSIKATVATISAKIGAIEAEVPAIKASIPHTVTSIVNVIAPPIAQTAVQTFTPPLIQSLVPPLVTGLIPTITGGIINQITNITNIVNQFVNVDLSGLEKRIDAIPNSTIAAFIASPMIFQKTKEAAKAGTCEASVPGGCIDVSNRRNSNNVINAFNAGADVAQLALLNIINGKLGEQILDKAGGKLGIGGALLRIGSSTVVDRLLNAMTFAVTMHNAVQLSSNIGVTLIQVMQNVIDFFGLKDGNGDDYNLSQLIGSSINNFTTAIVGQENLANFKATWAQYSRIYAAGANLFSSFMSMGDTLVNAANVISGQNAKIGNALRIWGAVGEKAYGWMNITPNFSNPLLTKLQSLDETASMVEQISQEPLNVKSAKEGLEIASKELADSLSQEESAKQGKEVPEAKKVKEEEKTKEDDSSPQEYPDFTDCFPDDDTD